MKQKRTLKELVFRDNFLFGAVMLDEEICRRFLEIVLDMEISRVVVSREHSIVYNPEFKGVRLDVYAKGVENIHYNVEMQSASKKDLSRRARYYHSQLDMELLLSGGKYRDLPNCYVIFVCDFDPFEKGRYRYTFRNCCEEDRELPMDDGSVSVFLSTEGKNAAEVSPELLQLLDFVHADLAESQVESEDGFVRDLQAAIRRIKESREIGRRYMLFEEYVQEEREEAYAEGRAEGRAEGEALGEARGRAEGETRGEARGRAVSIIDLLAEFGPVDEELEKRIRGESDMERLRRWLKAASSARSLEEFLASLDD